MADTAIPIQTGLVRFYNPNTGQPLACGQVKTFDAGTAETTRTAKQTWKDQNKSESNNTTIDLDNTGAAYIFGDGFYDLVLVDKCGTEVYTDSNVGWLVEGATPDSALPDLNI